MNHLKDTGQYKDHDLVYAYKLQRCPAQIRVAGFPGFPGFPKKKLYLCKESMRLKKTLERSPCNKNQERDHSIGGKGTFVTFYIFPF
jgi:hypothetical protein